MYVESDIRKPSTYVLSAVPYYSDIRVLSESFILRNDRCGRFVLDKALSQTRLHVLCEFGVWTFREKICFQFTGDHILLTEYMSQMYDNYMCTIDCINIIRLCVRRIQRTTVWILTENLNKLKYLSFRFSYTQKVTLY